MSCFVKIASFHGILPPFRYVQDSCWSNKITSPWQDLMEPWKWPAVGNFGQNDPNITWWDLDGGHPGSAGISEDVIILAERTGTLSGILKILTTSRTESGLIKSSKFTWKLCLQNKLWPHTVIAIFVYFEIRKHLSSSSWSEFSERVGTFSDLLLVDS